MTDPVPYIIAGQKYLTERIREELHYAGIDIWTIKPSNTNPYNTDIVLDFEPTDEQRATINQVVEAHDPLYVDEPLPTVEQRLSDMEDVVKVIIFGG